MQVQKKACKALKEFLSNWDNDDDGDGDGDVDGDDDDNDDDGAWEEIQEFFVGLFLEDDELRGYYQRCFESGEFCCLVCGAIGKKNHGKRFKDCVALVQHSMSILRTLKRGLHRGFGMALCKVLGWDADRLPTIVMKGEPLGLETSTPAEAEVIVWSRFCLGQNIEAVFKMFLVMLRSPKTYQGFSQDFVMNLVCFYLGLT